MMGLGGSPSLEVKVMKKHVAAPVHGKAMSMHNRAVEWATGSVPLTLPPPPIWFQNIKEKQVDSRFVLVNATCVSC